jgi:RNA polymerase sigma-70 factor, ECF subfamily
MSEQNGGISDETLVEAVKAGDEEAFAELVRRYRRKVFITASRFVLDRYELDDVCQDIFLKVYKNIDSYRGDAPFEHWLMRIAVHTCYDLLRNRRREKGNVPLDDVDFSLGGPVTDTLSALDAKDILNKALSKLKPEERLVITLIELEERSVKEVAVMTGWSESNVKVRSFRARQALKKILGVKDED